MAIGYKQVMDRIQSDLDKLIEETEIKKSNGTASGDEIAFLGRVSTKEEKEQYVKDKLFIETGEDVEDIFLAL